MQPNKDEWQVPKMFQELVLFTFLLPLFKDFPRVQVLIFSLTWGYHKNIFNDTRVPRSEYQYYDPKTLGLEFEGMIVDSKVAPNRSFVLFHCLDHNQPRIDPTLGKQENTTNVI